MEWVAIITMVIEAIMQCMEDRSRPDIERGLRNPGLRETMVLRRIIRQEKGLTGRKLHDAVSEALAYAKAMPSEEITAMLAEAEERVQAAAAADHA